MTSQVDHFMYAVPSLDEGIAWATETFGAAPAYGGEHVGLGTRNALLSLGDCYLEIIAPDPMQAIEDTFGERLAALSEGGLVTWAVQGHLREIAAALASRGVDTVGPRRTQRQTADGQLLVWELLLPRASRHGGRLPFFIDWLKCTHPSATNPVGGSFRSLHITTPDADDLRSLLAVIGVNVSVNSGEPHIELEVATARGTVIVASTAHTNALRMG